MNLVLVSDGHLTSRQLPGRLDNPLETCVRKFRWILKFCHDNDAALVQAGDLFDNDRDWYILAEVAQALYEYTDDNVQVYTVPGQHDKYYRTKQKATNLGVLEKAGLITVLTKEPTIKAGAPGAGYYDEDFQISYVALYGAGWGDELPQPAALPENTYHLLAAHAPIAETPAYPGHQHLTPRHASTFGYHTVLCGDVHRAFHFVAPGCDVVNTGPIFRHRAEEYNLTHKPAVCLWQNGAINWHEIPHEAADVVISREHLTTGSENRVNMQNFTAKLKSRPTGNWPSLMERLLAKIRQGRYNPATVSILKEVMGKDAEGLF